MGETEKRLEFLYKGRLSSYCYTELSSETLMYFGLLIMLYMQTISPFYPICWFHFWLVWSLSLWIHFLFKVIYHGMLVNCGWNSVMCLRFSGLCFIYYTSQSFIVAWFSVCISLMIFYPLVYKLQNQNPKNMFIYFYFMRLCWLVL